MITAARAIRPFQLSSLLLSSIAATFVGCSGADQPAPAGDSASELVAEEAAGTEPAPLDPTHTTRPPVLDEFGNPKSVCAPREARECTLHYRDDSGQWHCPMSSQHCQLDGKGWTACGVPVLEQSGNIVLPR